MMANLMTAIRLGFRSGYLVLAALVLVFLGAHTADTSAAQEKPLTEVVLGFGSTDQSQHAKQIGLPAPPTVLARAERLIG